MQVTLFTSHLGHPKVGEIVRFLQRDGCKVRFEINPNSQINVKVHKENFRRGELIGSYIASLLGLEEVRINNSNWIDSYESGKLYPGKVFVIYNGWSPEGCMAINLPTNLIPEKSFYRRTSEGFLTSDKNWNRGLNLV